MNKLLIRILIFLIPIFLVSFGMEIFLRFAGNSYQLKSQQFKENLKKIEVLFLGNSHAAYGINPTVFDLNSFKRNRGPPTIKLTLSEHQSTGPVYFMSISLQGLFIS